MRRSSFLVLSQFMLIIAIVLLGWPLEHWLRFTLAGLGILIGIVAIATIKGPIRIHPEPADKATLTTNGIYRLIRHPMYTAVLLFCSAWVDSVVSLILWLLLLSVLCSKLLYEERLLRKKFTNYEQYQQRTSRLIPYVF